MTALVDFGARQWRWHLGPLHVRVRVRELLWTAALLLAALIAAAVSLSLGDLVLRFDQVLAALAGGERSIVRTVVVEWRLPRVLAALLFGAALAVAGAVFQSLTRNPLASPDIIGITSGAHTGGLVAIVLFGGSFWLTASGALIAGLLTAVAVYALAWRRGVLGFRLIIVGIGLSAMLTAATTYLLMRTRVEVAMSASAWGAGTLNEIAWSSFLPAAAVLGVALVGLAVAAPSLRQLELGDDAAAAMGVRVESARMTLVTLAVVLTAVVTASAGPIAFVALVAPQLARRVVRAQSVPLVPAACMGSLLLIVADLIARHVLTTELPVGMVTVVLGGAYLAWVLIREPRSRR